MTNPSARHALCGRAADLLLVLFALALAGLGVLFLWNENFWLDEYFSIHLADTIGWAEIPAYTATDVHPPLYYYILKLFVTVLGHSHIVYRLASFAAYLLMLVLALVLFRPAFGRSAALLFLCLMGPNVTALRYGTEVRMYSWAMFFVLLFAFAAWKLVGGDTRRRWWATLTAAGLAAAYTHYYALIAVALVYLALLAYLLLARRSLLAGWGIAVGVSVACYLPWLLVVAQRLMEQASGAFWLSEVPEIGETIELITGDSLSGQASLLLLTACCLLCLLLPGAVQESARRWLVAAGLLAAVGVPALGYAASALLHPLYLPRYFLPVVGLLWLAMAVAADGLLRRLPSAAGKLARVLLAALVLYALTGPTWDKLREIRECNAVVDQATAYVDDRYHPGDRLYSTVSLVDQRVLDFMFPDKASAAGNDPAAALPEPGGSLFLIYAEEDPTGDWAEALTAAGLQLDSWQGALLDNTWCRIYYYVPAGTLADGAE